MSVRKLTASLLTVLALALGGVATVEAQEYFPAADPFAFDPDFDWFEPVYDMDLADMKPTKRAGTGWFATYDRLNLYGSRPETDVVGHLDTKLDRGWGHRYEVGYMLPEENGWLFNWTENSVSAGNTVRKEALNRLNIPDDGANINQFGFLTPPGSGNNAGYSYRFWDIGESYNIVEYDSYELNKTWRMEPYHYGGILEPMVGVRWMRVNDTAYFNSYRSTDDATTIDGSVPLEIDGVDDGEQILTSTAITENEMIGPQIGFRYFKFRDRFTFSSDFRVFVGGNYQCSKSQREELLIIYDGSGEGSTITDIQRAATTPILTRNEEFFVGFDLRAELGYTLTKMLSVRTGFQVIDIGRGLWRGGDGSALPGGDNDQDLLMVGATFGINLNH